MPSWLDLLLGAQAPQFPQQAQQPLVTGDPNQPAAAFSRPPISQVPNDREYSTDLFARGNEAETEMRKQHAMALFGMIAQLLGARSQIPLSAPPYFAPPPGQQQ